ncbi:MAG: class I SAM-dependent methyltransferase [Acidobacteriota bacterium]
MPEWFENDALWEALAPFLFSAERQAGAAEEVNKVEKLLGLEPGARVLDMCCGPGLHAIELARRGHHVVGVDRTARYLELARRRAGEGGLAIEFVQQDMRSFCRPGAFDAVIIMYTSFGYFEVPSDDLQVLRNLCTSLKPGGRLLIEIAGKEVLARVFQVKDWLQLEDGSLFLAERKVGKDWGSLQNRWILIRGSARQEFNFEHRLYSGTELGQLLRDAGFSAVTLHGAVDGSPYDLAAQRLVALARK